MTPKYTGSSWLAAVRHGHITRAALEAEATEHEGNLTAWARAHGTSRQALGDALKGAGLRIKVTRVKLVSSDT